MDAYFYSENYAFSSAEQMAMDEWMLLQTDRLNAVGFRVYHMEETCTIGRNQRLDLIKERTNDCKVLVRRPTGGGTVFHGNDLIYSLTIPTSHELYDLKLGDLYYEIHALINRVFAYFSLGAELFDECVKRLPDFCFDSPNRFDLLSLEDGKKLGGSAIKKSKKGILIQGSLAVDLESELFAKQFLEAMKEAFSLEMIEAPRENPRMCCHWRDFCKQFTSDEWNFKL
jgi:lipoate-protein ligase A